VCAYAFGEGTLRYKFQGYVSLEIKLLKVLIPEKERTITNPTGEGSR